MSDFVDYLGTSRARAVLEELRRRRAAHAEVYYLAERVCRLASEAPPRLLRREGAALRWLTSDGVAHGAWTSRPTPGWLERAADATAASGAVSRSSRLALPGPEDHAEPVLRQLEGRRAEVKLEWRHRAVLAATGLSTREETLWSLSVEGGRSLDGLGPAPGAAQLEAACIRPARRQARPTQPPPASCALVLAPQAAGVLLHEVVGHLCEDPGPDQDSLLEALWGRRLVRAPLSYSDDPTLEGRAASYRVDDEGSQAHEVRVLDRGRLGARLLDRAAAQRLGLEPTGHGRRADFSCLPRARSSNARVEGAGAELEDLWRRAGKGLWVEHVARGALDASSGAVYLYARDLRRIEAGRPGRPVKPCLLLGEVRRVLGSIVEAGGPSVLAAPVSWCGRHGQTLPISIESPALLLLEGALAAVVAG